MRPKGIYVPNVTPFDNKGEIMYDALGDLVEFWISEGISGVVANASTGEAPYISREEKIKVIKYLVEKTDGRIQVFAGTGSMSTRDTIELTQDALDAGAEAALVTSPFFFKPSGAEIVDHFTTLLGAVDIPVILYNVPKFTGYSVHPETILAIAEECSNLVAVKDSGGNAGNMAEIIRLCGDKLSALSGAADMVLPALMLGGKGAIVAVGNVIPGNCVQLYKAFKNGDLAEAGKRQHRASLVNKVLVREHPQIAAIKAYLNATGRNAGVPRKPLHPLDPSLVEKIVSSLS